MVVPRHYWTVARKKRKKGVLKLPRLMFIDRYRPHIQDFLFDGSSGLFGPRRFQILANGVPRFGSRLVSPKFKIIPAKPQPEIRRFFGFFLIFYCIFWVFWGLYFS